MILFFLFSYCTVSLSDIARKISTKLNSVATNPYFRNVSLNIYDPCEINELKKFIIYEPQHRPKCLSKKTIDLVKNPETNTGYRYGAKEVWSHIFKLNKDPNYKKIMNGLKFSITTHLCRFYLKNKSGYSANPELFEKLYNQQDHNDFNNLLRFIYTVFLEFDITNYKIPVRLKDKLDSIYAILLSSLAPTNIDLDFETSFDQCFDILNCVGCEKCKLWGKVQVKGLLTAFRKQNGKDPRCFGEFIFFIQLMNRLTVSSVEITSFLKNK